MDMPDLDDKSTYSDLDPTGLRDRLRDMPRLCSQAWQQSHDLSLPNHWAACDNVVIGGMGGSAIAGDLVVLEADTGDTITVKHNVGNIHLDGAADKVLVNGNKFTLMFNGTDWEQLTPMMVLL